MEVDRWSLGLGWHGGTLKKTARMQSKAENLTRAVPLLLSDPIF